MEFAQERIIELKEMEKAVRTFNGGRRLTDVLGSMLTMFAVKRTFQTLPKHLRRRTMSHNVFRIPKRLREAALREVDEKEKPLKKPHRRFKRCIGLLALWLTGVGRRPFYLLKDYARRQRKFKWLETHLWHAKRMKMVDMWAHKIVWSASGRLLAAVLSPGGCVLQALHPRDKSVRACWRASQRACAIYDASYYGTIELRGPQQALIDALKTMVDPAGLSPGALMYRPNNRFLDCSAHEYLFCAGIWTAAATEQ